MVIDLLRQTQIGDPVSDFSKFGNQQERVLRFKKICGTCCTVGQPSLRRDVGCTIVDHPKSDILILDCGAKCVGTRVIIGFQEIFILIGCQTCRIDLPSIPPFKPIACIIILVVCGLTIRHKDHVGVYLSTAGGRGIFTGEYARWRHQPRTPK
jgi:hypothetical protein